MTNNDDFEEVDEAYLKASRQNAEYERKARLRLNNPLDPRISIWCIFLVLFISWFFFKDSDVFSIVTEKDMLIGIFFMLVALSFRG